ncbi:P-loop containing nucleoside triphosphate hydrolase protein [Scleroderma yunnanense]
MSARNVILIGEAGTGKSSIINSIVGRDVAEQSNDAKNPTPRHTMCYSLTFSPYTQVKVWETPGLGQAQTMGSDSALEKIQDLLRVLRTSEGVHLLILCMKAGRATKSLYATYKAIYETICRKEVPIALVITQLEREDVMHDWWVRNSTPLQEQELVFNAHACVTTLKNSGRHIATSTSRLRKLVLHEISVGCSSHDAICPVSYFLHGSESRTWYESSKTVGDGSLECAMDVKISTWSAPIRLLPNSSKRTHDEGLIMVIGPTGSGKSTFISRLSGADVAIAGVLQSCTSCVQVFSHINESNGKPVVLLDAPGFKQSLSSDEGIVNAITTWMKRLYKGKTPLLAILYLHPITNDRTNAPFILRILSEFSRRCGGNIMSRVSFVTTMWDDVDDVENAKNVEAKLKQAWYPILKLGAIMVRHDNTHESAKKIVQKWGVQDVY